MVNTENCTDPSQAQRRRKKGSTQSRVKPPAGCHGDMLFLTLGKKVEGL